MASCLYRRMIPRELPLTADAVDGAAFLRLRAACREHRFLPTFSHGLVLQVGMIDPLDEAALSAIRAATHQEVRPFGIAADSFAVVWSQLAAAGGDGGGRVRSRDPACAGPPHSWLVPGGTARDTVVTLVRYAFNAGASDLLLDDQEQWLDIAIKRSGRKEVLAPIERERSPAVFRAFKEIAALPTHTVAGWLTGAARIAVAPGRWADLRIEVTPTVHGESLVARLQDRERQLERMTTLPFPDSAQRAEVIGCLRQSQGLIIATGPTGQGKTTTLYACLGQLDPSRLNIRTLEDPVEFTVPWITQIPVGAGTTLDFAGGLKSLLRQAPHVILMGELRDRQAAQTCFEAVETGHLLLATLHTRDSVGVVARLLDLGISGRQIAAGLQLSIGQRLLRRLCPACRRAVAPSPSALRHFAALGLPRPESLFAAPGCDACQRRGEIGQCAVFELFCPRASETVENLVARADIRRLNERALRAAWTAAGGEPLVRKALSLALAGEVEYAEAAALDSSLAIVAP
jgi:type II secretory ATPase GspE/PulE/Tfp pilus assembly ATPase PilB-like protein